MQLLIPAVFGRPEPCAIWRLLWFLEGRASGALCASAPLARGRPLVYAAALLTAPLVFVAVHAVLSFVSLDFLPVS